jgi:peptide-methionine (R)-S-oxide reductase
MSEFSLEKSDSEWKSQLSPERYAILRQAATEPAFSGSLLHIDGEGAFRCAGCETLLFAMDSKFESGCGWPSFDSAVGPVLERPDHSHGMMRTEILCGNCGGHLGHVFNDGPRETTGLRYCVNSLSLEFDPSTEA